MIDTWVGDDELVRLTATRALIRELEKNSVHGILMYGFVSNVCKSKRSTRQKAMFK